MKKHVISNRAILANLEKNMPFMTKICNVTFISNILSNNLRVKFLNRLKERKKY